jgi:hypothetical protein
MEVCGDSATQYGESEACIISFLSRSRDITPRWSGDYTLMEYKSVRDVTRQVGVEVTL